MRDYFYQIKGKDSSEYANSPWAWPPLFCGKVSAQDKKEAKLIIEEEYCRKFPLRVLRKDLEQNHYLLNIREIAENDQRTRDLFNSNECQQCGKKFRRIDLYNDHNESYKGSEYCSQECKQTYLELNRVVELDVTGNGKPVIYRIRNIKTDMSYVGKTTQVFTLRWYQHFYQGGACKFHQAIKDSNLDEWEFRILEIVDISDAACRGQLIADRERFWIKTLDTIECGYNSAFV